MPKNKDLKRVIRSRASRTGESYMTARRHVVNARPNASVLVVYPGLGAIGGDGLRLAREALLAAGVDHVFEGAVRYTGPEDVAAAVRRNQPAAVVIAVAGHPPDAIVLLPDVVGAIRAASPDALIAVSADVFHSRHVPLLDELQIDALVALGIGTGDIWGTDWSATPPGTAAKVLVLDSPKMPYDGLGPWADFAAWLRRQLTPP